MPTIKDLLKRKGDSVYSISADAKVYEALKLMADKEIGALLVIEDEKLVGIISERDYARKIILKGKFSKDTLVREIMATEIFSLSPGQTIEGCMGLMTEKRIRHMPVLEEGQLVGMISIGDVVNALRKKVEVENNYMRDYIRGVFS